MKVKTKMVKTKITKRHYSSRGGKSMHDRRGVSKIIFPAMYTEFPETPIAPRI